VDYAPVILVPIDRPNWSCFLSWLCQLAALQVLGRVLRLGTFERGV